MSQAIPSVAYVGLGANLGDRLGSLVTAVRRMQQLPHTSVDMARGLSSIYETTPHGVPDAQPPYLNAVIRVCTGLAPVELLTELCGIEQSLGRVRTHRGAARLIDLDLLFCDDLVMDGPTLTLPHPRLHERRFVLEPLAEIAADLMHPVLKCSIRDLLPDARRSHFADRVTQFQPAPQWLDGST